MNYSFAEFLELDKETQKALGNIINEELKPSVKKRKMKELEKLLKKMDFFYQYIDGDYKEWKKYHEMAQDIRKLEDLIGDDAVQLHRQYAAKVNYDFRTMEHKNTHTPTTPVKDEVKERQSIFPEQNVSQKNISLGYGDGYVLPNKHHFADTPFDTCGEKWQPPKKRKYDY
tara:strand:+ start:345 stop:857 length:513 start_codon:yes stop_codon:yes gene_type:complete